MDDVGKAVIMAAEVLMFVIAITISVYLYNMITENTKLIMLSSNYDNLGDSISGVDDSSDSIREVERSEIIFSVLSIFDDQSVKKVTIDGEFFKRIDLPNNEVGVYYSKSGGNYHLTSNIPSASIYYVLKNAFASGSTYKLVDYNNEELVYKSY